MTSSGILEKEDMPTHVQQSESEIEFKNSMFIRVGSNSGNGSCEKGISLKHVYYYYVYPLNIASWYVHTTPNFACLT